MYFFEALQYPFNSKGWINKAAIAGIMLVIPLVNIFAAIMLAGYMLRLIREISDGNMELLEFDYGGDFSRGLTLILYSLIYIIPMLVVSFLLGMLLGRSGGLLGSIIGFFFSMLIAVVYVRYALTEDTGVFMQFGDNIAILRENLSAAISYLINSFFFGLVGGIIVMIGFVLCVIPGLILLPMLYFGSAYMLVRFGQDMGLMGGKVKAKNFG